ncbi:ABC transporter ATP-binding protein/permease [Shinella curvata]|uniref:ABC transporter ATP-binding protein/permease n=1 Tax=Shinella curvata TaxID=1817964 RepID=A0ABT8XDH2_9HYPH|nr:ABC transporter ATP-binding protein [Shinella curvata]MCJ8055381.1 ABC transporter ATP-binding protein/permease [Shinella curvata]MDO6121798.1 ABC transporter ATP-binding protein/permease [Shinella curvata]
MMKAGNRKSHAGHSKSSDYHRLQRLWSLAGRQRDGVLRGILYRFAQSISLGFALVAVILVVETTGEGGLITPTDFLLVTLLLALSLAGQLVFGYLASANSWTASFQVSRDLRLSILDRLRALPLGQHMPQHRGDPVTLVTSDIKVVETFLADALPRLAQAFGIPVVAIALLVWVDVGLAMVALVSIVLSAPVFLWSSRRLAALALRRQDLQAEASARMIEYARGIAVIKAFNRIHAGQKSFHKALIDFRDVSVRIVHHLVFPLIAFGVVLTTGVPLPIFVACLRFFDADIDQNTPTVAIVLVFSIYTPLLSLIGVMEISRLADAALVRFDRIMMQTPLPQPCFPSEPRGFALKFDRVQFAYGLGQPVLKQVTFEVPEKSVTAIVGPSGAGKSTLLNLLPRFFDVDDGAILIGGVDVREISAERLNDLITVVFQEVYLFSGTILDNIAIGRMGADEVDIRAAAKAALAHDFIMALPDGYATRVGEGGSRLSGGERQRISIARAILKDAPIVLLDEATAAIDATSEREIQRALSHLVQNKTLVVVAHKLSTIRHAHQIIVLDQGGVVEIGSHETLAEAGGLYQRLWRRRLQSSNWRVTDANLSAAK